MAAKGWEPTDEIREKFKPIIEEYLKKMEELEAERVCWMEDREFGLVLTGSGINPAQLETLLEELGYEETDTDRNGWEMDFWITMKRTDGQKFPSGCQTLIIAGCGMIFDLKLCVDGHVFS